MLRFAYGLGIGYLAVCGLVLLGRPEAAPTAGGHIVVGHAVPQAAEVTGGWFATIRSRCNAVEAEVAVRSSPPPAGTEGASYLAGCYALAGKMDRAKAVIEGLSSDARMGAARVVFGIVHPVADAGDDRSAGPMMRLVLDYDPENYMALYHAGMSEYALGEHGLARGHLERFLELYKADDGWVRNARQVLERPEMKPPAR